MADPFLKPCPFCGGKAVFEEGEMFNFTVSCVENDGSVECVAHQAMTEYKTKWEAARAWNTRVPLLPKEISEMIVQAIKERGLSNADAAIADVMAAAVVTDPRIKDLAAWIGRQKSLYINRERRALLEEILK